MVMPMADVLVLPTPEQAVHDAAQFVAALAEDCSPSQGRFTIALSGGSTPRLLYQALASPPYAQRIAWDRWQVFWGDERCVPPDHEDSNYLMAERVLLDHVPIPPPQVHRMRGEVAPEEAALEYEDIVRNSFQVAIPSFDLILLGLGDDGHTASLFPGTQALQEEHRLVVPNWAPHLQVPRITFTLPLINAAREVVFLVAGQSKANAVTQVLGPSAQNSTLPAALVRPTNGSVRWFLDTEASSLLEGSQHEARAIRE